jgi:uncharacterized phage protein (TIGR01671 family)
MKREIKFKGKRIDNGTWVQGFYCGDHPFINLSFIVVGSVEYKVETNSVMQFTGLKDKEGNEIYEGDIVQYDIWDYPFEVIFNQERARFVCKMKTGRTQYIDSGGLKVVGNVYDNYDVLSA